MTAETTTTAPTAAAPTSITVHFTEVASTPGQPHATQAAVHAQVHTTGTYDYEGYPLTPRTVLATATGGHLTGLTVEATAAGPGPFERVRTTFGRQALADDDLPEVIREIRRELADWI